jgi:hypothetical protein
MKKLHFFLLIIIGCSHFFCEEKRIETSNIREKASAFINEIDSAQKKSLHHWYYIYRGANGFWQNDSIEDNIYTIRFAQKGETKTLNTYHPERFITDFFINVHYDTSMHNLTLIKTNNRVQFYKNGDKLIKVVYSDSMKKRDPFAFFSALDKLKNKYELIEITHHRNMGQFIEFYFSTSDVLTYIPDSSRINPEFKHIKIRDWNKGEWINQSWNLRKLEEPIEVGG